jgi:ABC-2 type transport system permease protein
MLSYLADAIWIEARKAQRSRMPPATALGFLLMPLVVAFFMVILKDPEFARQSGLISAKAQMVAGTADWRTFLGTLAQAVSLGGIFLFSIIATWVFGREFADGTVKEWLAVPIARTTLILAKFVVVGVWSGALTLLIYAVGLLLGVLVGLPGGSAAVLIQGSVMVATTAALVVAVMTPVAWLASVGRGYLLPLGVTLLFVLLANVIVVTGYGEFFPWAVPALYAGAGGGPVAALPRASYWVVVLTALAGMGLTMRWWQRADHSR